MEKKLTVIKVGTSTLTYENGKSTIAVSNLYAKLLLICKTAVSR